MDSGDWWKTRWIFTLWSSASLLQLVAPDNLESKFRELEGSNVDLELAEMKAKLGTGRVAGEVGSGPATSCGMVHFTWLF